jgi:cytochrome b561
MLETPLHFDTKSIKLHWLTAALVILLWCLGQTIDWFPRGAPRVTVRSIHICVGVLLACIFLYRIWWRGTAGNRVPGEGAQWVRVLAKFVHWALYATVLAAVVLGVANVWVRGDSLFGLLKIPAFAPGNTDLRRTVEDLHGLCANIVLSLVAVHAAAALVHHYVWKDNVLRRMLSTTR